ncbi:polysaccharide lyase family 7 protein [Mariniflexile ostreae]|uniref:Polysaccharide lyase family 7 protein n=1 Tax=Mariniflexile ostreae TaxID=1520892 RepID=A0ABV5F8H0_9FLAO
MKLNILRVSAIMLFFMSCSTENDSNLTTEVLPEQEVLLEEEDVLARASTGRFDFADFDGETTYAGAGGSISSRAYFNPTTTDNQFYFDVNSSGQRVFKCNQEKSHRTEIKEKSGKESALTTSKDMEYIGKLENIPNLGVTVGQVHNRGTGVNRPLIRVYVENGKFYIKTTTNNPTLATGTYSTITGPNYTSGSTFTLRIRFSGGNALVNITTTSGSSASTITPTPNWDGVKTKYYLKAGVYTEGNDKDPKLTMFGFDK